jgi:hypothetical protein
VKGRLRKLITRMVAHQRRHNEVRGAMQSAHFNKEKKGMCLSEESISIDSGEAQRCQERHV